MGGKRSNQEYGRLLYHRYRHTHLHTLSPDGRHVFQSAKERTDKGMPCKMRLLSALWHFQVSRKMPQSP
jgi:hypothetical protein